MPGEWWTPAELAAARLPELPDERAIRMMADRKAWRKPELEGTHWRKRAGRGGGYEYHISALPRWAQVKLAIDAGRAPVDDGRPAMTRAEAWAWFDTLPEKKKQAARDRMAALDAIETLVKHGIETVVACLHVAKESGVAVSTLYRWREVTRGLDRGDWLPALAPRQAGRQTSTDCTPEAWEAIKADYLRPEQPNFSDCYRRLVAIAGARGWVVPSSTTLQRRMEAIPEPLRVLARQGAETLKRMYPAQERDRSYLHALEAVNADGHKWDVFVKWPDGTVGRPMMCAFQDLYSGLILSWRVDRSATAELTRLTFGDLVEGYGIPAHCYFDNGRDFTSKLLTGGTPNRYRFKLREEEPLGILTQLGVAVHFTNPYSGQSKPIERAFRDMAQGVAKHPRFAGAWCGNKPDAKPENYASHAVPLDLFLRTIGEGIAEHNARVGRDTRVCQRRLSFSQAFAASYAASAIKKATAEQQRLWLLAAELVGVSRVDGTIELQGNRFWGDFLATCRGQKVTVRFDPQALQAPLHVYRSDGGYLGQAQCVLAAGFTDVAAAQSHNRARKAWMRAQVELLRAENSMTVKQLADMLPAPETPAPLPETKVIRPFLPQVRGAAALRVEPEDDDMDWLLKNNEVLRPHRGLHLVRSDDGDD